MIKEVLPPRRRTHRHRPRERKTSANQAPPLAGKEFTSPRACRIECKVNRSSEIRLSMYSRSRSVSRVFYNR